MGALLAARGSPPALNEATELAPGDDHKDTHAGNLIYGHHFAAAYYGNGLVPAQCFDSGATPSIRVTTAGGAPSYVKALTYVIVPRRHMLKVFYAVRINTSNAGSVKLIVSTTAGVAMATSVTAVAAGDQNFTATTTSIASGETARLIDVYIQAGAVNGDTATLQSFTAVDADLAGAGELP